MKYSAECGNCVVDLGWIDWAPRRNSEEPHERIYRPNLATASALLDRVRQACPLGPCSKAAWELRIPHLAI